MFNQIYEFFAHQRPMSPAASWFLILLLFIGAALVTFLIRELDIFAELAISNTKDVGVKGILYAARGLEARAIRKERVISVARRSNGLFVAHTYDGKYSGEYSIIGVNTDDSEEWEDAKAFAGGDKKMFEHLRPESRVRRYFALKNKTTGEVEHCFLVYLKYDCTQEVQDALNRFFEDEYHEECREARKSNKKIA